MRKTYLTKEYKSNSLSGLNNLTNFNVLMDIQDNIIIDDRDIVYYSEASGEQTINTTQTLFNLNSFDSNKIKNDNHELFMVPNQSDLNNNLKWNLLINKEVILSEYIFAEIKKSNSLVGVTNADCGGDVNNSIRNLIKNEILSLYELIDVKLYVEYIDLLTSTRLKYDNKFMFVQTELNKITLNKDKKMVMVNFTQEKPASNFVFNYYFDLFFVKI